MSATAGSAGEGLELGRLNLSPMVYGRPALREEAKARGMPRETQKGGAASGRATAPLGVHGLLPFLYENSKGTASGRATAPLGVHGCSPVVH